MASADILKKRGVRLAIVGLGGLNMDVFKPLVGPHGIVDQWDARRDDAEPNPKAWLSKMMACAPPEVYPCRGRIFVAYDRSNTTRRAARAP